MLLDEFIAPRCEEKIITLFEDQYLLVINKPSGLLSLSGKNPVNKDSVHYRIVQNYPTATMVHRLDFGTSGVMVLALNKSVNAHLTKQFQARTIAKTYIAILFGHVKEDEGLIDEPLASDVFPYQKVCYQTGKEALTHYRVLERLEDHISGLKTTRVEFKPLTGRTHQLRVHSLAIGHPIVGCDLYSAVMTNSNATTESLSNSLCLHASCLEFKHPVLEKTMTFKC